MRLAFAAALALAATPATADTLIDNVDGLTLTADGTVARFSGVLIDDNGRFQQIFQRGERRPTRVDFRLDAKGRVMMPGLIDSHVELMPLALSRIAPAAPGARPRPEDRDVALFEVQKLLIERGITTVIDMGTTIEDWQTYRRAGDAGALALRVIGYAATPEDMVLIAGPRPTPWLYDDRLRLGGLRVTFSAAPPAPTPPVRPARGAVRPPDPVIQLKNLLSRAGIDGFQAAVTVRDAASLPPLLDAVSELAQTYKGERRWRFELATLPGDADLARMAEGGVIASLLPQAQAMPAALAAAKLRQTFGSGSNVALPETFTAFAATLRREDALAAQTSLAAWAAQAEGRIGRIAIGQRADFLLVDRDPLFASLAELRSIKVHQTWIGGKMVYRGKEDAPQPPAATPEGDR